MKHLLRHCLIFIVSLWAFSAQGTFIVHNVSGNVQLTKGGKTQSLSKGDKLMPSDHICIAPNALLEIINDVNNTIYTSTKDGTFTVSRILLDAKSKASDNHSVLSDRLRFGSKTDAGTAKSKVYVETGMVKRSMAEFDPSASGLSIDPKSLARHITDVARGQRQAAGKIPVTFTHANDSTELAFSVSNTFDFPIYFNVIKIEGEGSCMKAEISNIGQPMGTYVLQPRQTMSRTSPPTDAKGLHHVMVITHCQYDIDAVLDNVNSMLAAPPTNEPEIDIPVYVTEL